MGQLMVVIVALVGAVAYLVWYGLKGRKKEGSCPNCALHEKIAQARKRQPIK